MTDTQQEPEIQDKQGAAQAASQALVQQSKRRPLAMTNGRVVLNNFDDLQRFCQMVCWSGMVPKQYDARGKGEEGARTAIGSAMVSIMHGAELGMSPLASLQGIQNINGKPSLYGDAFWARVTSHPDYEDHREVWDPKAEAWTCSIKRKGKEWKSQTFSYLDAKTAKLWGKQGPWTEYPRRQCQWRARGWCARDTMPDAFSGVWLENEAMDLPDQDLPPGVATQEPVEGVHHFGNRKKLSAAARAQSVEADTTGDVEHDDQGVVKEAAQEKTETKKTEAPAQQQGDNPAGF